MKPEEDVSGIKKNNENKDRGRRLKLLLFQGVGCSRLPGGEQTGPVSRPAGP